jgi:hypothetical protein
VGGTLGIAVLGTLLTTKLRSSMGHLLATAGLAPGARASVIATAGHGRIDPATLRSLPAEQAAAVQHAFQTAFMDGWHLALLLAGVAILGAAAMANRFVANDARGRPVSLPVTEAVAAQP